jgi:plastocyanin
MSALHPDVRPLVRAVRSVPHRPIPNQENQLMRPFLALAAAIVLLAPLTSCGGSNSSTSNETKAQGQTVKIEVTEKGFEPASAEIHAGEPVTLLVTRKTEKTCATELVMPEHQINQPLPLNQEVAITFTPTQEGQLTYACAMNHYKGTLMVHAAH